MSRPAQTDVPQDIPDTLVPSDVYHYALAVPKVFWHTGVPQCPPTTQPPISPRPFSAWPATAVNSARFTPEEHDCDEGQIYSNIVADDEYIYWIGPQGLMQLSTDANPGDPAQLVNVFVQSPGELAIASDPFTPFITTLAASTPK